jgi:DNA mismatch repair protein MutS
MKTPLMQQYSSIKSQHPGKILLFQMGDFYETFYDDASTISRVLGITLTSREFDRESGEPVPLAGFPVHALDGYMSRLLRAGLRVAVCEQTEDPRKAKKLVRREVTEVVTPGTLMGGQALGEKETALLASICLRGGSGAAAFCDLASGCVEAVELPTERLVEELQRRAPREILAEEGGGRAAPQGSSVTLLEPWRFEPETARVVASRRLGLATLSGLGIEGSEVLMGAVGALLGYVEDVKKNLLSTIRFGGVYRLEDYLIIDHSSALALDLVDTRGPDRSAILADALDRTTTPQGARLWRNWLSAPPSMPLAIEDRHDAVQELMQSGAVERLRPLLSRCCDLPRQSGRLLTSKSNPRDLAAIAITESVLPGIVAELSGASSRMLAECMRMDVLEDVGSIIRSTLAGNPPLRPGAGDTIADGVSPELDEYRLLRKGGRDWIVSMEEKERAATGIPRLSIGFNRVFGYYIEVSRSFLEKVPGNYVRKQTLTGGERFITPELKEMESRMLRADEEISRLEKDLFEGLRNRIASEVSRIRETGDRLAEIDVLCSMAAVSAERKYTRPRIVAGECLAVEDGRHPVLDVLLPAGECVPNSIRLGDDRRILIITGPNMAGKSTYLRMAAQLLVLAQAGCFVPAASMEFSPADRIFTRIGSSDRITRGQSTFLLEMADAALILNSSTPSSRAFIDEIGRGTSTYDGLSLAWAMVESLHRHPVHRPLTMFATHYHELTALGSRLAAAANVNVAVREASGRVVFLYKVLEGAADRSYGIHVASMAGVPAEVISRASRVLADLERGRAAEPAEARDQFELPLDAPESPLLEAIRGADPEKLTPRQALDLIYELRRLLTEL